MGISQQMSRTFLAEGITPAIAGVLGLDPRSARRPSWMKLGKGDGMWQRSNQDHVLLPRLPVSISNLFYTTTTLYFSLLLLFVVCCKESIISQTRQNPMFKYYCSVHFFYHFSLGGVLQVYLEDVSIWAPLMGLHLSLALREFSGACVNPDSPFSEAPADQTEP